MYKLSFPFVSKWSSRSACVLYRARNYEVYHQKTYAVKALLSRRKGVAAALATVKSITEVISTVTGAVSVMNVVAIGPAVKFVDGDGVKYVV